MSPWIYILIGVIYTTGISCVTAYCYDENKPFPESLSLCILWPVWGVLVFVKNILKGSFAVVIKLVK